MRLLIRRATILDNQSRHHGKKRDVLIENGVITKVQSDLKSRPKIVIEGEDLHLSTGWCDIGAQPCEPGLEYREDLQSLSHAAIAGGYTTLAVFPNTSPAIHSKSEVEYIMARSGQFGVEIRPIGAITHDCKGEQIAEMQDMHRAGAIGFSDGRNGIANPGVMRLALDYVKTFDSLIINRPFQHELALDGQMHEGHQSTQLGLPGIPEVAERTMLLRDLHLADYTGSRLHVFAISSAAAAAELKAYRSKQRVTCSVPAINLLLTDQALNSFDTHLKVHPPLRAESDRLALVKGIKNGTIQCVVSNHEPLERESKRLEFANSDFGATGLQTAFAMANTALRNSIDLERIIECFTTGPRRALGLEEHHISNGSTADLTLFEPNAEHRVSSSELKSKSKNSAVLNLNLLGRVKGIVRGGLYHSSSQSGEH